MNTINVAPTKRAHMRVLFAVVPGLGHLATLLTWHLHHLFIALVAILHALPQRPN
jgi:hypothetical protein